jgi:hypothetical protein
MKKYFLLLLFTAISYAQTNGVTKLKITANPEKTAATRVVVQDAATGEVGYVNKTTIVTLDATTTTTGKIQLAGDLGGTATDPTVPALLTKEPTIASGTTSQYYRGDKTWQTLDKTAVGLSNVDNTSDLNKPISTATQTALNAKENTANKNTANGYAGLGSDGKLISNQLPAITITDTFVVGSQAAMLALTAETGDVAVRTDLSKSYILKGSNTSVLADWQELLSPVDGVTSVFGRVGSVVANTGDYTTAQVTETTNKKYQTDVQALYNDATSSIQTQLNGKEILSNKSTATTLGTSDTLYPTQNAVKTYVDNKVGSGSGSLEFNSTDLTVWNNGKSNVDTNTSFGEGALRSNTTGGWNTAYGQSTLYNNTTGNFNTAVGLASLPANISGQLNTALGYGALNTSSTGNENTGLGSASLNNTTTGSDNLASGYNSLGFNTTGSNNVALGTSAGSYISPSGNNTISNQSVYLGAQTKTFANNQTNEIVVGYGAVGNGSNTATIGNSSITRTVLNGNTGIGTGISGSAKLNVLNVDSAPFLALRSTNNIYEIAKMSFDQNTDILSIVNNQGASSSGISFGTAGSEKVRINYLGNLGIGTTSPSSLVHIESAFGSTGNAFRLQNTTTASTGNRLDMDFWFKSSAWTNARTAQISAVTTDSYWPNTDIVFSNHSQASSSGLTERMRVTSTGNISIGTSSDNNALARSIILDNTSNCGIIFKNAGNNKGYLYNSGSNMYFETIGGSIYAMAGSAGVYLSNGSTSWTSNSDIRLKNINYEIENAVDKLANLKPVSFSWKYDETKKEVLGLIAQDVEKVFPQIIDKNKLYKKAGDNSEIDETEYLGVRYQELIPVLVKAIQEQQVQIKELQKEVEILKNK